MTIGTPNKESARLERELAYESAKATVECYCLADDDGWYSEVPRDNPSWSQDDAEDVGEALRYLELTGDLDPDPRDARRFRLKEVPVAASVCTWKEDEDGTYWTECDHAWQFMEGTPADNHVEFCPFCGRGLSPVPFEYDDVQDDE